MRQLSQKRKKNFIEHIQNQQSDLTGNQNSSWPFQRGLRQSGMGRGQSSIGHKSSQDASVSHLFP